MSLNMTVAFTITMTLNNYEYEYERDLDGEDDVGERGPYKAGRRECYP